MSTLRSSNGVYLKKLYTPDNKSCRYSVIAPNLPIKEMVFQESEYEKAIDYYEKVIQSRLDRQKI